MNHFLRNKLNPGLVLHSFWEGGLIFEKITAWENELFHSARKVMTNTWEDFF